jgi:hypothetical protein
MKQQKTNNPHHEEAIELSWTANAYLNCADRLCKELIDDECDRSLHHYRVPLHLTFLGLELFFKAGICAAGRHYPKHHDLAKLRALYADVMPDVPLPIPSYFEKLIPESLDLFEELPAPDLQLHFSRLRYASDRSGKRFPEHEIVDLKEFQKELDTLTYAAQRMQLKLWRLCGLMSDEKPRRKKSAGVRTVARRRSG